MPPASTSTRMRLESLSASCAVHSGSSSFTLSACARTAVIFISTLPALDAGRLDHFRPFRDLGPDIRGEPFGRARDDVIALLGESRGDLGLLQHSRELALETCDDRARRPCRCEQAL